MPSLKKGEKKKKTTALSIKVNEMCFPAQFWKGAPTLVTKSLLITLYYLQIVLVTISLQSSKTKMKTK